MHWNRAALTYCGVNADQITRESFWRVVHPEERPLVENDWEEAIKGQEAFQRELRLRRAGDGAYRWHLGRMVPERNEQGALVGWIATAVDIDDHKRAEEELQRAVIHRDDFLSVASHELRTPLTSLKLEVANLGRLAQRNQGVVPPARFSEKLGKIEGPGRSPARADQRPARCLAHCLGAPGVGDRRRRSVAARVRGRRALPGRSGARRLHAGRPRAGPGRRLLGSQSVGAGADQHGHQRAEVRTREGGRGDRRAGRLARGSPCATKAWASPPTISSGSSIGSSARHRRAASAALAWACGSCARSCARTRATSGRERARRRRDVHRRAARASGVLSQDAKGAGTRSSRSRRGRRGRRQSDSASPRRSRPGRQPSGQRAP